MQKVLIQDEYSFQQQRTTSAEMFAILEEITSHKPFLQRDHTNFRKHASVPQADIFWFFSCSSLSQLLSSASCILKLPFVDHNISTKHHTLASPACSKQQSPGSKNRTSLNGHLRLASKASQRFWSLWLISMFVTTGNFFIYTVYISLVYIILRLRVMQN